MYLPESSAAVAVTVFIVEPGGKRPLRRAVEASCAFFGSLGSYDGLAASTRTAPVLMSSATTAPAAAARRSACVRDLLGLRDERRAQVVADVLRAEQPRRARRSRSVRRPVSGSL